MNDKLSSKVDWEESKTICKMNANVKDSNRSNKDADDWRWLHTCNMCWKKAVRKYNAR